MIRFCKNQMALCLLYNAILVYDITGNSIVWYIYKYYKENIVFHALMIWLLNFETGSTLADAACLSFAHTARNTLRVKATVLGKHIRVSDNLGAIGNLKSILLPLSFFFFFQVVYFNFTKCCWSDAVKKKKKLREMKVIDLFDYLFIIWSGGIVFLKAHGIIIEAINYLV